MSIAAAMACTVARAVSALPAPLRRLAGGLMGLCWAIFFPIRRAVVVNNLKRVHGPSTPWPMAQRVIKVGLAMGRSALELVSAMGRSLRRAPGELRWDGLDHLRAALQRGRGVIILSAHHGPWEALLMEGAQQISQLCGGTHRPAVVVPTRGIKAHWLHMVTSRARSMAGVGAIPEAGCFAPLCAQLRRGGVVAIPLDQHPGSGPGVCVSFFGVMAPTSSLAALLTARTGATVLLATVAWVNENWHARISSPLTGPDRSLPRWPEAITAQWMGHLEAQILPSWEQWLWLHRRWKPHPCCAQGEAFSSKARGDSFSAMRQPPEGV